MSISTYLEFFGPPVPSLLPWVAKQASESDLPEVARIAAGQAELSPLRSWPVVTDAVAVVLAGRTRESPRLCHDVIEILPQVAAYLDAGRVRSQARFGLRPDAQAYASITRLSDGQPTGLDEAVLSQLSPLWTQVLAAARQRAASQKTVPPLAHLGLLARLVREESSALVSVLDRAELVYLLPYLTLSPNYLNEQIRNKITLAIDEWLEPPTCWFSAALLARSATFLGTQQRQRLLNRIKELGEADRWAPLFDGLCRESASAAQTLVEELAAAHPAVSGLDERAAQADARQLTIACQEIIGHLAEKFADPMRRTWMPTATDPGLALGQVEGPVNYRPEWRESAQLPLGAPDGQADIGGRLFLPGYSAQYRLLRFECQVCGAASSWQTYYDELDPPNCVHRTSKVLKRYPNESQ
jgi:hypothetical protein